MASAYYSNELTWSSLTPKSHDEDPSVLVARLGFMEWSAAFQDLIFKFIDARMTDLAGLTVDLFQILPSIAAVETGEGYQELFDQEAFASAQYSKYTKYFIPLMIVSSSGETMVATLVLADGELELFSPRNDPLMDEFVVNFVKPVIRSNFVKDDASFLGLTKYSIPTIWDYSNWWNIYFILIRFYHTKEETEKIFSDDSSAADMLAKRDSAVKNIGVLMSACIRRKSPSLYDKLFTGGRSSVDEPLMKIKLPNYFHLCKLPDFGREWGELKDPKPRVLHGGAGARPENDYAVEAWPAKVSKDKQRFVELPGALEPIFNL